jgi:hypothetical protein
MRQMLLLFKNRRAVSGLSTDKITKGDHGGEWGQEAPYIKFCMKGMKPTTQILPYTRSFARNSKKAQRLIRWIQELIAVAVNYNVCVTKP